MDWAFLEADQTAGGILLMWDKRVLDKVEVMVGTFSVSVKWQRVGTGYRGVAFGTLILFAFQASIRVRAV